MTNNNHLSAAALYASHGGAFSRGSDLSSSISNKTESLNSNSPAQVTEINSDDSSLDSHDTEKVSFWFESAKISNSEFTFDSLADEIVVVSATHDQLQQPKTKSVLNRRASQADEEEKS